MQEERETHKSVFLLIELCKALEYAALSYLLVYEAFSFNVGHWRMRP